MTTVSGNAAAAKSLTFTNGYGGMCLQFVRLCWGVASKYANAKTAWNRAVTKHLGLGGIPVGAPLFLSHPKSADGHVVIWLGNNKIRSTNSSTNRVATYDLSTWQNWGYSVQGWVEDLNGVSLPLRLPTPSPAAPSVNSTAKLQSELNRVFPAYSHLVVDGISGPATKGVIKEFQRRSNLVADGIVGPKTSAALARNGVAF